MTVLTISREYGSGGTEIASEVAGTLGYHLADKATIAQMLSQYGFIKFGKQYDSLPGFWGRFDSRRAEMVEMLNRVIFALAAHGNMVIVGRGSFALLSGYADVLNVRTQAPLSVRIERVMNQHNISRIEAENMVNENDLIRSNFIESSYNVRWDSAGLFDLVLDTSKVLPASAVSWLTETLKGLGQKDLAGLRTTAEIRVQSVLAREVSISLNCRLIHK
jgi:cytidylate kinase